MRAKNLILFSVIFILSACSADISFEDHSEKNAEKFYNKLISPDFAEVHCWVNSMPNSGNLVYLSGELSLTESKEYDYRALELSQVRIYQNDSLFYFVPLQVMENKFSADSTKRELIFNTYSGLPLKENFETGKNVLLDFIFKDGRSLFSAVVRNIYLEKVF